MYKAGGTLLSIISILAPSRAVTGVLVSSGDSPTGSFRYSVLSLVAKVRLGLILALPCIELSRPFLDSRDMPLDLVFRRSDLIVSVVDLHTVDEASFGHYSFTFWVEERSRMNAWGKK